MGKNRLQKPHLVEICDFLCIRRKLCENDDCIYYRIMPQSYILHRAAEVVTTATTMANSCYSKCRKTGCAERPENESQTRKQERKNALESKANECVAQVSM